MYTAELEFVYFHAILGICLIFFIYFSVKREDNRNFIRNFAASYNQNGNERASSRNNG